MIAHVIRWLPDRRTEAERVADYVLQQQLGRAERVGASGFRLDRVKHGDKALWKRHRAEVRRRPAKDFYLNGEVCGADKYDAAPGLEDGLSDALIEFGFRAAVYDFPRGFGQQLNGGDTAAQTGRGLTNRSDHSQRTVYA